MPPGGTAPFSIYLVRCANGSLYTGISTDVDRRLQEHSGSRRGARALRGRGPLELVFAAEIGTRSAATRVENRVKRLTRSDKEALVSGVLKLADVVPGDDLQPDQASGEACA